MGKAAAGVTNLAPGPLPLPVEPLLDMGLQFFNTRGEGECRLRLFSPPQGRDLAPWTVWLSQGDTGEGPQGLNLDRNLESAVSAAWQNLMRLRQGDWPVPADPRLDALPLHPSEVEWIEYRHNFGGHSEQHPVALEWDGHTPRARA